MKKPIAVAGPFLWVFLLLSLSGTWAHAVSTENSAALRDLFFNARKKANWLKHTATSLEEFREKLEIKLAKPDVELVLPAEAVQHILSNTHDTLWLPAEQRKSALSFKPITSYPAEWLETHWVTKAQAGLAEKNNSAPLAVASTFRLAMEGSELPSDKVEPLLKEKLEMGENYVLSGTYVRIEIDGVVFESVPPELLSLRRK